MSGKKWNILWIFCVPLAPDCCVRCMQAKGMFSLCPAESQISCCDFPWVGLGCEELWSMPAWPDSCTDLYDPIPRNPWVLYLLAQYCPSWRKLALKKWHPWVVGAWYFKNNCRQPKVMSWAGEKNWWHKVFPISNLWGPVCPLCAGFILWQLVLRR